MLSLATRSRKSRWRAPLRRRQRQVVRTELQTLHPTAEGHPHAGGLTDPHPPLPLMLHPPAEGRPHAVVRTELQKKRRRSAKFPCGSLVPCVSRACWIQKMLPLVLRQRPAWSPTPLCRSKGPQGLPTGREKCCNGCWPVRKHVISRAGLNPAIPPIAIPTSPVRSRPDLVEAWVRRLMARRRERPLQEFLRRRSGARQLPVVVRAVLQPRSKRVALGAARTERHQGPRRRAPVVVRTELHPVATRLLGDRRRRSQTTASNR